MRDSGIEGWLDSEGVGWVYLSSVPLSSINHKKSLANQARFGEPIVSLWVETFLLAIKNGVDFPANVVYKDNAGDYVDIDGNHRYTAKILAEKQDTDVYCVKTDDRFVIDRLTRTANNRNGHAFTQQEIIEHAKYLVQTYNRTRQEIAGLYNISVDTLSNALKVDKAKATVRKMGVKGDNIKTAWVWTRLSALDNNNVLAEAVRLVNRTGMATDMVNELVTDVRRQGTEERQLAKITEWTQKPEVIKLEGETRRGKNLTRNQREQFFGHITAINNLIKRYSTADQLLITSPLDVERFQQGYTELRNSMSRVAASVPRELIERVTVTVS